MEIRVQCLNCPEAIEVPSEWAGETVVCPSCRKDIVVPERIAAPPATPSKTDRRCQDSPRTPSGSQNTLSLRYLTESDRQELSDSDAARQLPFPRFAAGCALIALGFYLTRNSKGMIYFGAVWVGIALILESLCCAATATRYRRTPMVLRIISWVLGFLGAMVFSIKIAP